MPCNSDYLEPNRREIEHRRAALLLKFALLQLGRSVDLWIERESRNNYARDPRTIPMLCDLLTRMPEDKLKTIVYDAANRSSRDLASWWEDHLAADRKRLEQEQLAKTLSEKRKRVIDSLTPEAKEFFGIEEGSCLPAKSKN